ncbi:MAG TPA: hypothetical protein PKW42_00865 [bacterium]|nr:hypothetical protein [bacterium]
MLFSQRMIFLITILMAPVGRLLPAGEDLSGSFSLQSGPYLVEISRKDAFTMKRFSFDGVNLGVATGFYGTIFAPGPGKYIGAGHTEGGKEEVKTLELKVDGQPLAIEAEKTFTGQTITFRKVSHLANLELTQLLRLAADRLVLSRTYRVLKEQPAYSLYVFQFCWSPETREWLAQLGDGRIKEGQFLDDDGWRLNEDIKWTAVYSPAHQKGVLLYYPEVIPGQQRKSCYRDRKGVYHKYYLMMKLPALLSEGTLLGPYTAVLVGFKAPGPDWKKEAARQAELLQLNFREKQIEH